MAGTTGVQATQGCAIKASVVDRTSPFAVVPVGRGCREGSRMNEEQKLDNVIEAVLLWFSPGPWVDEKAQRWLELTGSRECTDKALCAWLRKMGR